MLWSAKMENKASANDDSGVKVLIFCQQRQQNSAFHPSSTGTKGLSLLLLLTSCLKHQPARARRSHRLLSCCSLSLGGPWPHPTFWAPLVPAAVEGPGTRSYGGRAEAPAVVHGELCACCFQALEVSVEGRPLQLAAFAGLCQHSVGTGAYGGRLD